MLASQLPLTVGGLIGGLVIGLTGMGGGALLTPMLVLVFKVNPLTAVSSDLVVSLLIKPVGATVHGRRGTVNRHIVTWLCVGSIPTAFAGAAALDLFGARSLERAMRTALGVSLVVAAVSIVTKIVVSSRRREATAVAARTSPTHPAVLIAIGALGGLIVGFTSVGSGSLIIVLLMWACPYLTSNELVGTDLTQAIPLVAAAALGHVIFGQVDMPLVGWLLAGALPGVYLGSRLSSRASDRVIRPTLVTVLGASGLKLLSVF